MTIKLSRRRFLGASLVLCALPSRLFADHPENVVLRFAVMSDVHYPGNANAAEQARFKKALAFMNTHCAAQTYPNFDALVVAGDMSNNGTRDQIGPFKADMDAGLKPGTQPVLCMGNHEFWGGSKPLWEEIFGVEANTHTVINGYHFIAISPEKGSMRDGDYDYIRDWVKAELDAAAKDAPGKPIFVIQHYHVSETVYGSIKGDNWGTKDFYELFQQYPQIIDFSGHSHYPITDPRSAWQGNFTAFGTGTLSYFEMTSGQYNKFPAGHRNVGQFYVVEVHRDHSVVLKPYDLISGGFYDTVYTVTEPGNTAKYLYTDARYDRAKNPWWKEGAAVSAEKIEPYSATFHFPQAADELMVHSYRLTFSTHVDDQWTEDFSHYAWSDYFYRPMPAAMAVAVEQLAPQTAYRLSITALNCFQKESEKTLMLEFTTPRDPEDTADKTAAAPAANVLDVHFAQDGAVNTPTDARLAGKTVTLLGEPKFVPDAALGCFVANFDGEDDACKVPFTAAEYARLTRAVTMGVKFRMEEFSATKNASDVFANTEHGGYAFEINHRNKTLEFWCHAGGKYVVVSAPIAAGQYVTAFGVYDGRHVILYLDGKEAARREATGPIHYTTNNAARAFCVGADINSSGGGSAFFAGTVAFARVYGWALTAEQVGNLSK